MTVLGIVSEYNPFHNGHLYHLKKSIEVTKADAIVTVMSGNFTQRGEPALFNKWIRTEAALKSGINLVIELPVCYSTSSAELFAFGAVSLLNSIGIVDYISFGSENGDIKELMEIAKLLSTEDNDFKFRLKNFLKAGYSFARARQLAIDRESFNKKLITSPNNILGIEYLKWLIRLESKIVPVTIKRLGPEYNDQELNEANHISSATSIRNTLKNGDLEKVLQHLPYSSYEIIRNALLNGQKPVFKSDMERLIYYELIKNDEIEEIFDVSEGLHKRIKDRIYQSQSLDELLLGIKTKRYAYSRLSRILFHILIKYTKDEANSFNQTGPLYVRILGFDNTGRKIIREMKDKCALPIITNLGKQYNNLSETAKKMMHKDILSTDIYSLLSSNDINIGQDYVRGPVVVAT